jgi:hypothetical protein
MERQLRWYMENLESGVNEFQWNVLVINEGREIRQILRRLHEQLAPVSDERIIDEGLIEGSGGLHYCIREMTSPEFRIDFSEVYKGMVVKDRRLQPKETSNYEYLVDLISSDKL